MKFHDGSWSQSVFAVENEDQTFADENFIFRHVGPGIVSMVNRGPDSNGSGFYISLVECGWMNDKNVAFGCLCNEESMAVLFEIGRFGSASGKPTAPIVIQDCGQLYP